MIPINEAEDYIFGMVLLNDWSARDIQNGICATWTLSKKFCIINITLDCYYGCLEPFRVLAQNKIQSTTLFATKGKHSFDIHLEVAIQPENAEPTVISKSISNICIGP
jgi:fumarylacetoacetase